jgi:hypothetical protein
MIIYTVSVGIRNITTSTNSTLYFSTGNFCSSPASTPANTYFDPRIIDPGTISLNLISDDGVNADPKLDVGEVIIANIDGAYDYLISPTGDIYALDGRELIISYGDDSATYPSGFTTLFKGTCDGIEVTYDKVIIRARDNAYLLDKPLLTDTYLGTNVLPNGVEGTANDIKGELKPYMFGYVNNFEVKCCNTSKLIYKVNQGYTLSGEAILGAFDKGVPLTAGSDYTSQLDMEINAPLSGEHRVWPAGGYIRLGSSPAGRVTVTAIKGTSITTRSAATIMNEILAIQGLSALSADVTALNALNNRQVGIYIDDDITIKDALNKVARSIGAYFYYDRLGQIRLGRFTDPAYTIATPVILQEYDILNIEHVPTSANKPYSKYIFEYHNVETAQTKDDLAGSVPQIEKQKLNKQYKKVTYTVPGVSTNYKSNKQLKITTRFISESHCLEELNRIALMFTTPRRCYEVTIHISAFTFDIMQLIFLSHNRFGLNGLPCAVISYSLNLAENNVTLKLWG